MYSDNCKVEISALLCKALVSCRINKIFDNVFVFLFDEILDEIFMPYSCSIMLWFI